MTNLLNAANFFGNIIENWSSYKTAIWLIIIQALFVVIAISLIIYLILRRRLNRKQSQVAAMTAAQPTAHAPEVFYLQESKTEVARELTGISLDLGVVQRDFEAGDDFSCEGLIIKAEYNISPLSESIVDYTLIDEDTFNHLVKKDKSHGVYVIKPAMYTAGKKVINVKLEKQTASYTISVKERKKVEEKPAEPVQETAPAVEEKPAEPQTIVVEKIVERPAEEKTRELLSISLNTENVQKQYVVGDSIDHEGLVVTAHFNVEPLTEEVTDYSVLSPDMSKKGKPTVTVTYQGKTVGYQIVVKPAPEVVAEPAPVVEEPAPVVEEQPAQSEPQTVVVEKIVEKPVVVEKIVEVEKVVEKPVQTTVVETVVLDEESVEAGRLRYDKSFEARLIQSDDDIKHWYTEIKNELLSYNTCKGRISWKRETFKANKQVVAMLVYRGKKLCLFLALNPAEYVDEKYDTEDASDIPTYVDTPVMIRLKNEKRVRIAKELIAIVMEQINAYRKVNYVSEDFYVPYEGILELINRGLIKREIKTSADEAIFERDKSEEN